MILDRFRLDDKVAVVTGGGRGIGRAIALAYADAGADVVVCARSQDQIDDTLREIEARGRQGLAISCDVTKHGQLEALVEATMQKFGRIDVLVNNAGGWPPKDALHTSEKEFETAFRFNVTSAFELTRLVVPKMAESAGGGAVVNISSVAGRHNSPGFVAYGTAKAALSFMTQELAQDFAPKVRVNAIAVGSVETEALGTILDDRTRQIMIDKTPLARLGQVEDIAACALFLASPASSYVTGEIYGVNGGLVALNFDMPRSKL